MRFWMPCGTSPFATCLYFHTVGFPSSFLFLKKEEAPPLHFLRSTAMKSDTSARQGGGGGESGGLKRRLQRVSSGCILGIQLNEAVGCLGNHLHRCQTTRPMTPPTFTAVIKGTDSHHPVQSCLFSRFFFFFFVAVSNVLKGICVIRWKHLASECDPVVPFSHKLIKWILTETTALVWICGI